MTFEEVEADIYKEQTTPPTNTNYVYFSSRAHSSNPHRNMDKCLMIVCLVLVAAMATEASYGGSTYTVGHGGPLIIPYPLKIPFVGPYGGSYHYEDEKKSYGKKGYGGGSTYLVGNGGPLIIPQPITWVDQHHSYY